MVKMLSVRSGQIAGRFDIDVGFQPANVATYCPGRTVEHHISKSTHLSYLSRPTSLYGTWLRGGPQVA